MMVSGHKVDHIAAAVVHKQVAVADPIGFAVGRVAVHTAAVPGAGSIEPAVLVLDVGTVGTMIEDMATEAAGQAAVVVVYYNPLEDMVMMIRKSLGSGME
jgi:hypothetical protein